jgi:hypothetical protein
VCVDGEDFVQSGEKLMHWILTILIAWNGRVALDHQEYFNQAKCTEAAALLKRQYESALDSRTTNAVLFTCTPKDKS